MKTAIVILNWNGENFLRQFLPTLIEKTNIPETEIIVADNASSDGSLEYISSHHPSVRTILLDKNYGFAGGYNRALQQVDAQYYLLLNSDIEVTDNWLPALTTYLDQHPDVAACQPKIRSFYNRSQFEHAGASGGFIDRLGYPFCRGRILGVAETDNGQYDDIIDIFWATGACLLIRADIFKKAGGFDDVFFAHMEEIDLCWRIKNSGERIVCIPQSTVYHVGGGTLNAESPFKTYLNFRNNLLLLYKNLPRKSLRITLLIRFFLDYIAALQLYLTGKPKNAHSVFKARCDYRKMKRKFKQKRVENLSNTKKAIHNEIYNNSIIIDYYLKSKKTFNKIMDVK